MNILRKNRKSNYKYNKKLFFRVIFLIFSLIVTTFAWFTYYKILNDEIDIHIVSWDLEYLMDTNNDETLESVENPLEISVPTLYPGMDAKEMNVTVRNNGESNVDLSCLLTNVTILGQEYEIVEDVNDAQTEYYIVLEDPTTAEGVSSQDIINDTEIFPFTISIENDVSLESRADANIKVTITWVGDNDELDSQWGHNVAKYLIEQEDPESVLQLTLQVNAVQALES